ncbi:MAG TPA: hypothetical protein VFU02_02635, partial [Polyangiaceae bacterium]|nr:hypothetical protein [Polyangiaceae bacterium]
MRTATARALMIRTAVAVALLAVGCNLILGNHERTLVDPSRTDSGSGGTDSTAGSSGGTAGAG